MQYREVCMRRGWRNAAKGDEVRRYDSADYPSANRFANRQFQTQSILSKPLNYNEIQISNRSYISPSRDAIFPCLNLLVFGGFSRFRSFQQPEFTLSYNHPDIPWPM